MPDSATPWATVCQVFLSFTISQSLLKLMSIESVMPSNHLILFLLPSIFPSIRAISNESALRIRWPKYEGFNFSIISSNEYSGLISFRIDWFDLFAVQGTVKSLLQQYSSKASILLYGPILTSIRDYWKNHSFDYMDLCGQSNVFAGVGGDTIQPTPQSDGRNDWTHDMIPLLLFSPPCCVTQTQCSLLILLLFTLSSFSNLLRKQK